MENELTVLVEETNEAPQTEGTQAGARLSKYPEPKILLVDMKPEIIDALTQAGYNVTVGSFGQPYAVEKSNAYSPIPRNFDFPINHTEQDIVIVNLEPPDVVAERPDDPNPTTEQNAFWTQCMDGVIDARPLWMGVFKDHFDRILEHGGIFIIFGSRPVRLEVIFGHKEVSYGGGRLIEKSKTTYSNWGLLTILDEWVNVEFDQGHEINPISTVDHPIQTALTQHRVGGSFDSLLSPRRGIQREWAALATNKFERIVAAAIAPSNVPNESDTEAVEERRQERNYGRIPAKDRAGWVLIYPRPHDIPGFLLKLLSEGLPNLPRVGPNLFPYAERLQWTESPEYELSGVLKLRSEIAETEEKARQRVSALDEEIKKVREQWGFLHDLIRETGTPLVKAVKQAIETLGFKAVVNIDEEPERLGDERTDDLREDLWIDDISPLILVEVKGVRGIGTEEDKLQVVKYLAPRMKQLKRTDIRGLCILNHQRTTRPLDRDKEPFQRDVLATAIRQEIGLMTTWDLFRLVRSYVKLGWQHEQIQALFCKDGRVEPVPTHYEYIGTIQRYIQKLGVVGIQMEKGTLRSGDRIAYELPTEFEEEEVPPLELDSKPLEEAAPEMLIGMKSCLTKEQARTGVRVFKVGTTDAPNDC